MKSLNNVRFSSGFTLVELMISLVLGLLITAAVMQVYFTMVKTKTIQQGGSEITEVSVFGIQQIEQSLRIANLGNDISSINSTTPNGGIILSDANVGGIALANGMVTSSTGDPIGTGNAWTGKTGTDIGSDQLTLQYKNVTGQVITDCESGNVQQNEQVVERYFLRTSTNDASKIVLACDAGKIRLDSDGKIAGIDNFGGAGEEIILNVEQFKIAMGVQTEDGKMSYVTPNRYKNTSSSFHDMPIVAVRLGLIVRSDKPVLGTATASPTNKKIVLGEENQLSATSQEYVRKTYESTTMLRNARLITITVDNVSTKF